MKTCLALTRLERARREGAAEVGEVGAPGIGAAVPSVWAASLTFVEALCWQTLGLVQWQKHKALDTAGTFGVFYAPLQLLM